MKLRWERISLIEPSGWDWCLRRSRQRWFLVKKMITLLSRYRYLYRHSVGDGKLDGNFSVTKRVQFVICITIAPYHPPIMGIQSLMRACDLLFKCAIRITWWPTYEYSWLSVKRRHRNVVKKWVFMQSFFYRQWAYNFLCVYILAKSFSLGQLFGCLVLVNHVQNFQRFWRLTNKESATDVVRPITLSVIGQFDVIVLDLIGHSMFWRISQEF